MSDLEQIINGEQPEPIAEPAEETKAEPNTPVEPEPTPDPVEDTRDNEISGLKTALAETRGELRALKQQSQPQPEPPQAPEFVDPEGTAFIQQQVQTIAQNMRLDASEEITRGQHGDEVVDAAFAAFQANASPGDKQAVMAARSPWGEVVKWHQRQTIAQEVGDDPAAYRARIEKEVRAQVEAEMVAKQAQDKAAQAAPSMANVTGTGGGPKTAWAGPTPLDSVIGS